MRRGRPRHDDILTPREWEVLDLLKRGLTNAEIADRLSITRDTAKFHVSEIITKLGVANRDEAASWSGRPRVAFGLAPLATLLQNAAAVSPWKLAAGAGVAAGGAAMAALLLGVLLSGSTHTAGVPVDTVTVRWIEEDPPPPVSWEAPRPFADLVPTGTTDTWRAYIVEGNAAPKLLLETQRYLDFLPTWDGDTVLLPYSTRKIGSDGVLGALIHGLTALDTKDGDKVWDRITDEVRAWATPHDGRLAQTVMPGQVYVTDPDGTSLKLEGIFTMFTSLWSPNGEYFITMGEEILDDHFLGPTGPFTAYILTPGEPVAIKLNTAVDGGGNALPRPSPDGSLLMYPEGDQFAIVDVNARTIRRLPIDVRDAVRTSVPTWSADGRFISYGEAVIDVENGTLVRPVAATAREVTSRISPGGRWLVVSSSSYIEAGEQADCPLIDTNFAANRTRIIDLRDGSERGVLACLDMAYSPWQWLDESHVLMTASTCARCDRPVHREWALLNAANGTLQSLGAPGENAFAFDVREDGRTVIGGDGLHVYESEGRPVSRIPSPDSRPVRRVAWSPDGSTIVFITGPEPDLSQFYGGP